MSGEKWYLVVDGIKNSGTSTRLLEHEFNSDSSKIIYIDDVNNAKLGRLVISDLSFSRPQVIETEVPTFFMSPDKARIAYISGGKNQLCLVQRQLANITIVKKSAKYNGITHVVLGSGDSVVFLAERDGSQRLVLGESELPLPAGDIVGEPEVRTDGKAVGVFMATGNSMKLIQIIGGDSKGESSYDLLESLTFSADSRLHAYSAQKGTMWCVVVNGKEGPTFDRVVGPLFSPDSKYVAYRVRKDGQLFVVVADAKDGRIIKQYPPYEKVFQPVFTATGKAIGYGIKDGNKLVWKVEPL